MEHKRTLLDYLRFAAVVFALALTVQMIALEVQNARLERLHREMAEASERCSQQQSRIENDKEADKSWKLEIL